MGESNDEVVTTTTVVVTETTVDGVTEVAQTKTVNGHKIFEFHNRAGSSYINRDVTDRIEEFAWSRFAEKHHGLYDSRQRILQIVTERYRFQARPVYDTLHDTWHTELRLWFEQPLTVTLKLRSESEFFTQLGKALGRQDVEVGHDEFDENFVVKGKDERRLKEIFSSDTCKQVLAIAKNYEVEIVDEGIFVVYPDFLLQASEIHRMYELVGELANAMLAHRDAGNPAGIYR